MAGSRIKILSIQVKNFRSIRNEIIKPKDLNIFVGLNDVGKSNILKALNLFFNSQTDYNTSFDFQKDFTFLFPETSHSTKEIKITLQFLIPDSYKEKGIYTWIKTWRINNYYDEEIINSCGEKPNSRSRVPSTLKRIKYRYVPAVKCSDYYKTLLSDLYTTVSSSLNNPLVESTENFSKALRTYTKDISTNVFNRLNMSSELSIPNDLNDIFKSLIFRTSNSEQGINIPLNARGDGIQALHIPIILKYIATEDQNSRNQGSMKITTIWGYEEPENGLELLKAFDMANEFDEYSKEIQIFTGTHSPAFYMKRGTTSSQIFFVNKKSECEETSITTEKSIYLIADNMGLMPLVAPFIAEQAEKLEIAREIYSKNILTDVPTIMVEGDTDIGYLKHAIYKYSEKLQEMINCNHLRIICKNDGAGATQLCDWALAWIFSGFRSKMYILLDKDSAGISAKTKIENSEAYKSKQNSISMKVQYIEPSDDIIMLLQKHIKINYEIEHLLSCAFWQLLKVKRLVELRSDIEMHEIFSGLIPMDKTLYNVIDDIIGNNNIRDTILTHEVKYLKKKQTLKLFDEEKENFRDLSGFQRTIDKLEYYFTPTI